jgi:hypothetical protein
MLYIKKGGRETDQQGRIISPSKRQEASRCVQSHHTHVRFFRESPPHPSHNLSKAIITKIWREWRRMGRGREERERSKRERREGGEGERAREK